MESMESLSRVLRQGVRASLALGLFSFWLSAQATPPVGSRQLEGGWQKPCSVTADQDVIQIRLKISGENWVWQGTGFESEGCVTPYLVYTETKKALFSENGSLDLTFVKAEYLPISATVADSLRRIGFCNLKNWTAGVVQDVTGLTCGDRKIPQRGETSYSRFLEGVDGHQKQTLFLGEGDREHDGSGPLKRHRDLEKTPFFKMESGLRRQR